MQTHSLLYQQSVIQYFSWGNNSCLPLLVCLHGYGESAGSFTYLAEGLKSSFNIIAIDLPFHGGTNWKEGLDISPEDILAWINEITGTPDFSLLGYSMGARIALQLYQLIPHRIHRLMLLAPDGLVMSRWYWLATQTGVGKSLFRYCMQKPGIFFKTTGFLKKMNLVPSGIYNYTVQFLRDAPSRDRLFQIWTGYRKIKPAIGYITQAIYNNKTQVDLVYGRYDTIIKLAPGQKFAKQCGAHCHLHVLDGGHRLLQQKYAAQIATLILHTNNC